MTRCMPTIMFIKVLALNHTSMSPMADSAIVDIKEPEFCRAHRALQLSQTKIGEHKCKTPKVSEGPRWVS